MEKKSVTSAIRFAVRVRQALKMTPAEFYARSFRPHATTYPVIDHIEDWIYTIKTETQKEGADLVHHLVNQLIYTAKHRTLTPDQDDIVKNILIILTLPPGHQGPRGPYKKRKKTTASKKMN